MDQYLEAFSEEQRSQGYSDGLLDMRDLVDVLRGAGIEGDLQTIWDRPELRQQADSFSRLLESIRYLLE